MLYRSIKYNHYMGQEYGWLKIVAEQHSEWIKIVHSFGEYNYAEDLVQEMYLALIKYAKPEKIIKDGKANRGYVFFTLRSIFYQYYNKKKKINKVSLDNDEYLIQIPDDTDYQEQEAFYKICKMIDQEAETWHWYDRKLFKLYRDTDLSIRKIAEVTSISWVSIFNTLKNCKEELKEKLFEDWEDYQNKDYGRI